MKIVPTIYEDLSKNRRYPFQFTFFYRVSKKNFIIQFLNNKLTKESYEMINHVIRYY